MKSLKTKVLSGVVAVGLLSGVGAAFANTDAGTNLKNWYDGQFGKSQKSIAVQTGLYAASKVPGLTKEYNSLKTGTTTDINGTKTTASTNASNAITAAKQAHLDALAAKKAEIEAGMKSQFDGIQQDADTAIGLAGEQVKQYAYNELTNLTNATGTTALDNLTTELDGASKAAHDELQLAITNAKKDLQAQLNKATADKVESIKGIIDRKIAEIKGLISQKASDLVAAQQALINQKAAELQAAAEADMDKLVSDINK